MKPQENPRRAVVPASRRRRPRGSFEPPRALCIPDGRVSAFRTQWSETNCRHYDATVDPADKHEDHDSPRRIRASKHTLAHVCTQRGCTRAHTHSTHTHTHVVTCNARMQLHISLAFSLLDLCATLLGVLSILPFQAHIFFAFYTKLFQRRASRETFIIEEEKIPIRGLIRTNTRLATFVKRIRLNYR